MIFSRVWAMPSPDTFTIKPVGDFVRRYLESAKRSVDPFARNGTLADVRNDLNPATAAHYHLDAVVFLKLMQEKGETFDLGILDPPYSPRQVSDHYAEAGIRASQKDTQNATLYANVRNALAPILTDAAIVLSFGWSTSGMGKKHGFEIVEIMLVNHGGAHNDTICIAEKRLPIRQPRLL